MRLRMRRASHRPNTHPIESIYAVRYPQAKSSRPHGQPAILKPLSADQPTAPLGGSSLQRESHPDRCHATLGLIQHPSLTPDGPICGAANYSR